MSKLIMVACKNTDIFSLSAPVLPTNRHRLPTNRHRLPTNRHRLPTDRHQFPTGRHHRAYWTLRVFFFFLLRQPLHIAGLSVVMNHPVHFKGFNPILRKARKGVRSAEQRLGPNPQRSANSRLGLVSHDSSVELDRSGHKQCQARQGCIGRGGDTLPPPPSRAPSQCPATVPLTASASLSGICNRQ